VTRSDVLVTVVWQEGQEVRSIKGMIIDEDEEYLILETQHKKFKIFKRFLVKIEEPL